MNGAVTHDVITVALPFLAILAGTFFNRAIAKVEADVKELRAAMEGALTAWTTISLRLHSVTG